MSDDDDSPDASHRRRDRQEQEKDRRRHRTPLAHPTPSGAKRRRDRRTPMQRRLNFETSMQLAAGGGDVIRMGALDEEGDTSEEDAGMEEEEEGQTSSTSSSSGAAARTPAKHLHQTPRGARSVRRRKRPALAQAGRAEEGDNEEEEELSLFKTLVSHRIAPGGAEDRIRIHGIYRHRRDAEEQAELLLAGYRALQLEKEWRIQILDAPLDPPLQLEKRYFGEISLEEGLE